MNDEPLSSIDKLKLRLKRVDPTENDSIYVAHKLSLFTDNQEIESSSDELFD